MTKCHVTSSGRSSWAVNFPRALWHYFSPKQKWTIAFGDSEIQWCVPPSFFRGCRHIIRHELRDWLRKQGRTLPTHVFLVVYNLDRPYLRIALDEGEMRRLQQKDHEQCDLRPFLDLLGLKPSRIIPADPPDFLLKVDDRKIAVELTDFYSDAADVPRIEWVRAWQKLQLTIGEIRNRHAELHDVNVTLVFSDQRLPRYGDHERFAKALVHFVLTHMPGQERHETTYSRETLAAAPVLGDYMEQLELEHIGCYRTWDLPPQWFSSGVTEDELLSILKRKQYASKAGAEELWLVIAPGANPYQWMGRPDAGILNGYARCNAALDTLPYDKVFLVELTFGRVLRWQRSSEWQLIAERP